MPYPDSSKSDTGEPEVIPNSSSGDIILVCGEQKQPFQVSASILAQSSPFAALINSQLVDGQTPNVIMPPIINMPEDDAHTMEDLLRLLHHDSEFSDVRNSVIPEDTRRLLRLSIAGDKFRATKSLSCVLWLQFDWSIDKYTSAQDINRALVSAYHLRDAVKFAKLSARLTATVDLTDETIPTIASWPESDHLPLRTYLFLNNCDSMIAEVRTIWDYFENGLSGLSSYKEGMYNNFHSGLDNVSESEVHSTSLAYMAERALELRQYTIRYSLPYNMMGNVVDAVQDITNTSGLCLSCVLAEERIHKEFKGVCSKHRQV